MARPSPPGPLLSLPRNRRQVYLSLLTASDQHVLTRFTYFNASQEDKATGYHLHGDFSEASNILLKLAGNPPALA